MLRRAKNPNNLALPHPVIPAKAGIHFDLAFIDVDADAALASPRPALSVGDVSQPFPEKNFEADEVASGGRRKIKMDSGFRRNDGRWVARSLGDARLLGELQQPVPRGAQLIPDGATRAKNRAAYFASKAQAKENPGRGRGFLVACRVQPRIDARRRIGAIRT